MLQLATLIAYDAMAPDPFTALSAATAVVQFVDFGAKLISKSYEIYKSADGVLADYTEQAAVASRLEELNRRLSDSITECGGVKTPTLNQRALKEATQDCKQVADDFLLAIDNLKVAGSHRQWKSFRQAFKSVWKKEGLDQRLVQMDRLRQQVMIHLLVVVQYEIQPQG